MVACATLAVATHEPAGASCTRACAVPWLSYRSPRSIGIVRWPLLTVGALPVTGLMSCHFGSTAEPLNWSDCGEQPVLHSTGVFGSEPDITRKKSNEAVPPPEPPRKATGPIFSAPVSGAECSVLPILIQFAPLSIENSPTMIVPLERARTSTAA